MQHFNSTFLASTQQSLFSLTIYPFRAIMMSNFNTTVRRLEIQYILQNDTEISNFSTTVYLV